MVSVTGYSQLAQQLLFTRNISLLTQQLNKQNEQLGSGRYAGGLIGVSQRALELGDLKSPIGTVDNSVKGVQTAQNRVALYATTIKPTIHIATDAQEDRKSVMMGKSASVRVNLCVP